MSVNTPNYYQVKSAYMESRRKDVTQAQASEEFFRWWLRVGLEAQDDFLKGHGARALKADAWDEGYRDGHNDGLSDGHPLFNDREPEENPYREANDD